MMCSSTENWIDYKGNQAGIEKKLLLIIAMEDKIRTADLEREGSASEHWTPGVILLMFSMLQQCAFISEAYIHAKLHFSHLKFLPILLFILLEIKRNWLWKLTTSILKVVTYNPVVVCLSF